jgi:hypothetical protein
MAHVIGVVKNTDEKCVVLESFYLNHTKVHLVRTAKEERIFPINDIQITQINGMPVRCNL